MGTTRLSAEGAVGRGLSPAIWQAYQFIGGNFSDPSRMLFHFDDFVKFPTMTSATDQDGYYTYQDTGVTIAPYATLDTSEEEWGVVQIAGNDAEDDEGHLELGDGTAGLVRIDNTVGHRCVVAAECRMKRTTVTDAHTGFYFGLAEPAISGADAMVSETHALIAKDFVGFGALQGSNDEVDALYSIGSGSAVQVTDNAATAVADTWMKLGILYDPLAEANGKLKFFVDGVEISYDTAVTDAIIAAGTAFPTDEELTLCFLTKNETQDTTAHASYLDWWAIGAYNVDV
jgi:hypothetical protein